MYEKALVVHSILRWIAIAAVAHAFLRALRGWLGNTSHGSPDKLSVRIAAIAVDVQLTVGLLLYFVWSPITHRAFADMGAAMKDGELRFWAVEHVTFMVGAVALVHVGKVLAGKAKNDTGRHRRVALCSGLALVLMIVGTPWPGSKVARPWLRPL
jgi:hypothetical protein